MLKSLFAFGSLVLVVACAPKEKSHEFSAVTVETVFKDSVSIRAIEFLDNSTLAFAGSNGIFGSVDVLTNRIRTNIQRYDTLTPSFRAVAHTSTDFLMLSVATPALLYKTGTEGEMELVYMEEGEGVFYDAMKFWDDNEGIAIGDSLNGCLSVLITRDGGTTWNKVSCSVLPQGIDGEGAFAASNTNIEIVGDATWVATTESRVYFSPDRGHTWEIQTVPIVNKLPAQGIYSIDFYDGKLGIAFGGDYTTPDATKNNKVITVDGGKTWTTIADGNLPGYKSCVQFVPNSGGEDIVALGFSGITYSSNRGASWMSLSDEGFYTLQFLNDSIAYAAGRNRIAKLTFR